MRGPVSKKARRPGFTLVELMMSLIIIGMLASLLGVAVTFAINAAKNAATKVDIANLDTALQSYKNNYGSEYPSCMAIPPLATMTSTPSRYDLFDRSIRKRFPRYTYNYAATQTLLTQGNSSVSPVIPKWQVNSIGSGQTVTLSLDNLDAAEALVFWLAGPPTPTTQTSSTVLWGFSANPQTPFMMSGSRLPFLYEFDETRLTDVDWDGWPEYTPKGSTNKQTGIPPFVYFEPNSYQYTITAGNAQYAATYPGFFPVPTPTHPYSPPQHSFDPTGFLVGLLTTSSEYKSNPQQGRIQTMVGEWGFAVPYANNYVLSGTTAGQVSAWNPKKFQLIAPGLDYEYGGSQYEPPPANQPSMSSQGRPYSPVVPQTPSNTTAPFVTLTTGDNDNLTNFIDSKIEDYVP